MKNRAVGAVVMVILILFSVWLGGCRELNSQKKELDNAFVNGVDGDGYCINDDLSRILSESYNLITQAKNVLGDSNPLVAALNEARTSLEAAKTPGAKCAANNALNEAVGELYFAVKDSGSASDSQLNLAKQAYTEIQSRNDTIRRDGYNDLAREFNRRLSHFPLSFAAALSGVGPAELFE